MVVSKLVGFRAFEAGDDRRPSTLDREFAHTSNGCDHLLRDGRLVRPALRVGLLKQRHERRRRRRRLFRPALQVDLSADDADIGGKYLREQVWVVGQTGEDVCRIR